MYKQVLERIDEIAMWPIISLIIFFSFFVGLIWWVIRLDKGHISKMENLPNEDDTIPTPVKSKL
jgi:cytochrome c oxidase cbb3-type subunit IV